jgi:hypothetical protein
MRDVRLRSVADSPYLSPVFRKIAGGQSSNSTSAVRTGRAPAGPVTVRDAARSFDISWVITVRPGPIAMVVSSLIPPADAELRTRTLTSTGSGPVPKLSYARDSQPLSKLIAPR